MWSTSPIPLAITINKVAKYAYTGVSKGITLVFIMLYISDLYYSIYSFTLSIFSTIHPQSVDNPLLFPFVTYCCLQINCLHL